MSREEFEPRKLKKAKRYLNLTLDDIKKNQKKTGFFRRIFKKISIVFKK